MGAGPPNRIVNPRGRPVTRTVVRPGQCVLAWGQPRRTVPGYHIVPHGTQGPSRAYPRLSARRQRLGSQRPACPRQAHRPGAPAPSLSPGRAEAHLAPRVTEWLTSSSCLPWPRVSYRRELRSWSPRGARWTGDKGWGRADPGDVVILVQGRGYEYLLRRAIEESMSMRVGVAEGGHAE
eukprot:306636-Hanusia_phi.AAC.2